MIFARTGELCAVTGKYRCFGNSDIQITVKEGEYFPKATEVLNAFWILTSRFIEDQVNSFGESMQSRFCD